MVRRPIILLFLVARLGAVASGAEDPSFSIQNPLGLHWPWERVHFDLPRDTVTGDISVELDGELRPAQISGTAFDENDKPTKDRVWFMATLRGGAKGDLSKTVVLKRTRTESPLSVKRGWKTITVENGVYELRMPRFKGKFRRARALKDVAPPIGGVRPAGGKDWYGESRFVGEQKVVGAITEIVEAGPVFCHVRISYDLGRNTTLRSDGNAGAYDVVLTFVAGDPWIDVTEEYGAGKGAAYEIVFKDQLRPDTVMWIQWFGWERFGGNNKLNYVAVKPHPKQRGPFAILQPRWCQAPGHAQDFFVTRGGETPNRKGERKFAPSDYDAEAPAIGVVATHPTKWFRPYHQKIQCYAENGDTARMRFPVAGGGRSYALCVGPRRMFDATGSLNGIIRRHADWTLDDQVHRYILEWERDPRKAGPNILMSRERLAGLQADYKAGRDTPAMRVIRGYEGGKRKLSRDETDLLKLIKGEEVRGRGAPSAGMWLGSRYQDNFLDPTTYTRRISHAFPPADLFCGGKPIGGGHAAALGYIFSDLDQWPGWVNGWHPGNPNFHTDKYMVAIYAGAAMLDHPHAGNWLAFGRKNLDEDFAKTLLVPDGVGYECPGYSSYSFRLQLGLANVFRNAGQGNPIAENPMAKKTGIWHRNLLTPVDRRIGIRHQAPIGDTHRWGHGDGHLFGRLAAFYREADPAFASEMMGVYKLFREQGMSAGLYDQVIHMDLSIPPMPIEKMEWGSRVYYGFGSIMRSRFGTDRETFVTMKAGPTRGHYHNDELSYHFYGAGAPISLDYNCSYGPRGDHAALHNSMTFGVSRPYVHQGHEKAVRAMEQLWGTARVGAFRSTAAADVVVAERSGDGLQLRAVYPSHAIYGYGYPRRKVEKIVHRRYLMLVKHPGGRKLNDYMVIRDETVSKEPQQLNIHLLARDVLRETGDGRLYRARGQYDNDALVFFRNPYDAGKDDFSGVTNVTVGCWYYGKGAKTAEVTPENGAALIPPEGHEGRWMGGEFQKWLRIATEPGRPIMWVLYPLRRGDSEPKFSSTEDGIQVALGADRDEIAMATVGTGEGRHQVVVEQNGKATVLIGRRRLGPLGTFEQASLRGGVPLRSGATGRPSLVRGQLLGPSRHPAPSLLGAEGRRSVSIRSGRTRTLTRKR
ncbi:hypothetical protein ACFLQU_04010 [Verrucomicrobiota bacterium]